VRHHHQQTLLQQRTEQVNAGAQELKQWRRYMKCTISGLTFYFDNIEKSLKDSVSRWLLCHTGVSHSKLKNTQTRLSDILQKVEQFFSNSVNMIVMSQEIPPLPPQSRPVLSQQQQEQDPKSPKTPCRGGSDPSHQPPKLISANHHKTRPPLCSPRSRKTPRSNGRTRPVRPP
jgi:hypothetical protein